jgi:thiol-disulfide isomerase/thioredoxin
MRRNRLSLALAAFLYGAIPFSANTVAAQELSAADVSALKEMRSGDMAKLIVHDAPLPRLEGTFQDLHGNPITLDAYRGKVVLLNFWATWCPPCRAEMPSIDRVAGALGGADFAVIPLSTDRGGVERADRFLKDIQVQNLATMHDRDGKMSRDAGILGLPVTLILDREGREVARMIGDANWDSPEARALLNRLIALTRQSSVTVKT